MLTTICNGNGTHPTNGSNSWRIPPAPRKLLQKIINWEYIDPSELSPEQLNQPTTRITSVVVVLPESAYETQRHRKKQLQNIALWVQVFSIYMLASPQSSQRVFLSWLHTSFSLSSIAKNSATRHGFTTTLNSLAGQPTLNLTSGQRSTFSVML